MSDRVLTGRWIQSDGRVVGDVICEEIESLITAYLEELARDWSGWYTLFRDKRDGQLWERSYPDSYMHGGGPPQLAQISVEQAKVRYGHVPA